MEPKAIIILMVMVYELSDAVPSDHNRALHRLPEDRKRLSLFPKITKKFIFTPPPEEMPKHIAQLVLRPNNLTKKRLMPKIVLQYEKEKAIPPYKPPVTRRPLMKLQKFTLEPYAVQQSNEDIGKPNVNRYDTLGGNEKESEEDSMAIEDNFKSEEIYDEDIINDNESIENVDYDETDTHPKNIQHQEKNNVIITNFSKNDENVDYNERKQNQSFLNDGNIGILDPSKMYESEENVDENDNGENLNDSVGKEDDNEGEEANSENISDEIVDISLLDAIEHTTDYIIISNDKTTLNTEKQLGEEEASDKTFLHDQSSFSTIEPYLTRTINKDISDHNAKTSVTMPIEKTTDELIELYNIETTGSVMDRIRTRFKRNKRRSVNIIEEENLGTTISGFKFTGREPLLSSHLAFKNINT